jgi:ribosomal protein S6--L-glutamate ligase
MRLVSFDPLRTLGVHGARPLRPESFPDDPATLAAVRDADLVLFPQSWQVNALHYALGKRLFPSLASYHLGASKVEMTRAFQALVPRHVPETLISAADAAGAAAAAERFGFPLVVKEPRESMGRGVHRVESAGELARLLPTLSVLYAQELLPIERDLRVVWVGDRVLTAYWREGGDGFHTNISRGASPRFEGVPAAALDLVREVATTLGVDHAGFDVAMVGEHPYLFELNTLFGTEVPNAAGIDLGAAIADWVRRAV